MEKNILKGNEAKEVEICSPNNDHDFTRGNSVSAAVKQLDIFRHVVYLFSLLGVLSRGLGHYIPLLFLATKAYCIDISTSDASFLISIIGIGKLQLD